MLREIVRPDSEEYILKIPKEYVNQDIEILVLPFKEMKKSKDFQNRSLLEESFGILKDKNIDPIIWQEEIRSEWD